MNIIRLKDDFCIPNDENLHNGMEWLVKKYDAKMRKIVMCEMYDERMESFIQFIKGMIPDLYRIVKMFNRKSKKKKGGVFFFHKSFPYDIDEYNDRMRLFYNFHQLVLWASYARMLIDNGGIQEETHKHLRSSAKWPSAAQFLTALCVMFPHLESAWSDNLNNYGITDINSEISSDDAKTVFNHCLQQGSKHPCFEEFSSDDRFLTHQRERIEQNLKGIGPKTFGRVSKAINIFIDLIAPDGTWVENAVDDHVVTRLKDIGMSALNSHAYKIMKRIDGSDKTKDKSVVCFATGLVLNILQIIALRKKLRNIDEFTRKKNIAKMKLKTEYKDFSEYQIYILADLIAENTSESDALVADVKKWFKNLQGPNRVTTDHTVICACCCVENDGGLEPLKCKRCKKEYGPGIYSHADDKCGEYVCYWCIPFKTNKEMALIFCIIWASKFPNSSPKDFMRYMPDAETLNNISQMFNSMYEPGMKLINQ